MPEAHFLETLRREVKRVARALLSEVVQRSGPLSSFKLTYPDGPFLSAVFNLAWEAETPDGEFQQGEVEGLGASPDTAGVRRFYRLHPEARLFFLGAQSGSAGDAAANEEYVQRMQRWLESADETSLEYGLHSDVALEFEIPLWFSTHEALAAAASELAADPAFRDLSFCVEQAGGGALLRWDSYQGKQLRKDVREYRARNGFVPSIDFMKEYLAIFTGDAPTIDRWAERLVKLEPPA